MANQFNLAVKETTQELRHRLKRALGAHNQERLQMLYWIKTRTLSTRAELAERLERNESTIYHWLKRYQQGGIEALLTVNTAPGKVSKIPPVALEQLKQRLSTASRVQQLWSDSAVVGSRIWGGGVSNGASNGTLQTQCLAESAASAQQERQTGSATSL
jgi:transposase-like protein